MLAATNYQCPRSIHSLGLQNGAILVLCLLAEIVLRGKTSPNLLFGYLMA